MKKMRSVGLAAACGAVVVLTGMGARLVATAFSADEIAAASVPLAAASALTAAVTVSLLVMFLGVRRPRMLALAAVLGALLPAVMMGVIAPYGWLALAVGLCGVALRMMTARAVAAPSGPSSA